MAKSITFYLNGPSNSPQLDNSVKNFFLYKHAKNIKDEGKRLNKFRRNNFFTKLSSSVKSREMLINGEPSSFFLTIFLLHKL